MSIKIDNTETLILLDEIAESLDNIGIIIYKLYNKIKKVLKE